MSNEYQYAPFATPSTIRVIKIQEQKVNNEVACVIRHVDRTEFEYEALSYVWGNPKATRHIYLGNEVDQKSLFPLHENLWRFLNWAWGRRMFDRWIWTERICLNQEDGNEMSQEILKMGEIFHDARQVMAWLGLSEPDGEELLQETRRIDEAAQKNEYWSRVWVTQEICLARRVTVLVGNREVDFELLARGGNVSVDEDHIVALWVLRNFGKKVNLWLILCWITKLGFKCERPQDRVYGVLGMVDANSDGLFPIDHIKVDYDKSAFEVTLDALLQSKPPWIDFLHNVPVMEWPEVVTGPILDLLVDYLGSHRTSERNKELAFYTFQTCDALISMFDVCKRRPGDYTQLAFDILLKRFNGLHTPTLEEGAVMKGVALVLGYGENDKPGPAFYYEKEARQKHDLPAPSLWRCAEHMPRGQNSPSREEDYLKWFRKRGRSSNRVEAEVDIWNEMVCGGRLFDPVCTARACDEYADGGNCDGSTMMFEIAGWVFASYYRWGNQIHIPGALITSSCTFGYQGQTRRREKTSKKKRKRGDERG